MERAPENLESRFEKIKVFIPDLSALEGKTVSEVQKYIEETFGDTYEIAGEEYGKWFFKNPDKAPEDLKGHYFYHFFGATRSTGVPCVYGSYGQGWPGHILQPEVVSFGDTANSLSTRWDGYNRAVLLEK